MSPRPDSRGGLLDALKPVGGRLLQEVLNRVLALDPDAVEDLRELDGRRVELAIGEPALALSITAVDGQLKVGPADADREADLSVRGTLRGLLGQFEALRPREGLPPGSVRVSGDADLARRLRRLADRYDPDWERPFAEVFGEVVGAQLARRVREGLRQSGALARGLARDVADYISEERGEVATGVELDIFNEDVDRLREDVDRLERRIRRLSTGS